MTLCMYLTPPWNSHVQAICLAVTWSKVTKDCFSQNRYKASHINFTSIATLLLSWPSGLFLDKFANQKVSCQYESWNNSTWLEGE